jgi:exopolyphosphatase / guanosine-5'-triphosphate,3'-diphosphate pyrophosphatase
LRTVRRACIDIGSNTTRLLVADGNGDQLSEVHQERAFTRIGHGVRANGMIAPDKIADVVEVVVGQLRTARDLGAQEVRAVATAAIRQATNGAALVEAIRDACGVRVDVLSGEEEARLAFVGAARTLDHAPAGELGVVDVGGGSSELVVGRAPDLVSWCTSFQIGSGDLADGCLRSDPPAAEELAEARRRVAGAVKDLTAPHPAEAVAVGGSATSLHKLAGPLLDAAAFARSLALLSSQPAAEVAKRFGLEVERVRLLPAGLLILEAASQIFGTSLQIARGGVREGVLLEASE